MFFRTFGRSIIPEKMNSFRPSHTNAATAAAALLLFLTVAVLYFAPQFRGEKLPQHDVQQYEAMIQEILECRDATGEDPQWAGRTFSGMPAYLINVAYPAQLVKNTLGQAVKIMGTPAGFLFFAMLSMWLMLLVTGVEPRAAIPAALAYGLSTYFILIIGAGHVTKMWALVYAPLMMGGIWYTLRRDMWTGAALTALGASLEIGANHPQIAYYFLMAAAAFWIGELTAAVRARRLKDFARRTALLLAAGLLAAGSNFAPLWYTARLSGDTIRGGSELAATAETPADGLALDYATAWSYGPAETLNLLVPDLMGGESGTTFAADGPVAAALAPYGLSGLARQLPAYWGDQPYTAGPTYLSAAAILLAVLGCWLADGRDKWWIIAVSVLMILLAWGRHLMWFTELFFQYLPGYDKFRTVSMTLTVVQWTVPLLGALGLMRLWRRTGDPTDGRRLLRALAWAAGTVGGLCLVLAAGGSALFDFGRDASAEMLTGEYYRMLKGAGLEKELSQGLHEELALLTADAMAEERAQMLAADAWRSLGFVAAAAALLWLFIRRRMGRTALTAGLSLLILADLVPVDLRYLSHDRFVTPRRRQIMATAADKTILQDTDPGYRVLNLTVSPFNDGTTARFHRSVGGYHGAKLARYQDLIDRYLNDLDDGVLDMLNTRYVIDFDESGAPAAYARSTANGAAWLVEDVVRAASPQQEIDLIETVDTRRTAIVDERFPLSRTRFGTGEIRLAEYRPNYLRYEYRADAPALAVFSEIYYDKGWKAYLDGEEIPYLRADYVLRAAELPEGEHTVEWRFRAPDWGLIEGITLAASLAILAAVAAAAVCALRRRIRNARK